MEKGVALLDFENVDQMVQVHGGFAFLLSRAVTFVMLS